MSTDDNIRLAQQAYEDFKKGNIAAVMAAFDENIEWIAPGTNEISGHRKGRDQVAEFFRLVNEMWDFQSFEPREYIASADKVVALGHYDAKSRKTGRMGSSDWVMVWTITNGKVTHFQEYTDTATLERAVLPEGVGASA